MPHNWTPMASQQTLQAESPAGRELGFLGQGTPGRLLPLSAKGHSSPAPLEPDEVSKNTKSGKHIEFRGFGDCQGNPSWNKFFIYEEIPELRKAETNLHFMDLGTLGWSDQAAASPHRSALQLSSPRAIRQQGIISTTSERADTGLCQPSWISCQLIYLPSLHRPL